MAPSSPLISLPEPTVQRDYSHNPTEISQHTGLRAPFKEPVATCCQVLLPITKDKCGTRIPPLQANVTQLGVAHISQAASKSLFQSFSNTNWRRNVGYNSTNDSGQSTNKPNIYIYIVSKRSVFAWTKHTRVHHLIQRTSQEVYIKSQWIHSYIYCLVLWGHDLPTFAAYKLFGHLNSSWVRLTTHESPK